MQTAAQETTRSICTFMGAPISPVLAASRRSAAPSTKDGQRITVQRVRPRKRSPHWAFVFVLVWPRPNPVMFNDQADEDLMVSYQKGEVRAFEVLLSRHRK